MGSAAGVGLALTQAAGAASVGVDLIVNGDFEDVTAVTEGFDARELASGWSTTLGGSVFAYNYAQNYDDRNDLGEVPAGNDAGSSTDYYFTMNTTDTGAIQNVDLSSGETLTLINSGVAQYDVRGFFTNYLNDAEGGQLTLSFYDGDPGVDGTGASLLGETTFLDDDLDAWSEVGGIGDIDAATRWARISLDQNPATGLSGGPDVYIDNVSFSVNPIPEPSSVLLGGLSVFFLLVRKR